MAKSFPCLSIAPGVSDPILPVNQTVVAGENVTFYCILVSKFPASISWLKDGRPLNYTGLDLEDGFGAISEVLTLRNVGTTNSGMYSCMGEGRATHSATLTVVGM